jgi:hypothetical protein
LQFLLGLIVLDYEHDNKFAAFEKYSSRVTPKIFLGLLESRASTNQLTEEIKNEIVDLVQECRRFVYRRYCQSNRASSVTFDLAASLDSEILPPASNTSYGSDDSVPRLALIQGDSPSADLMEADDDFRGLFEANGGPSIHHFSVSDPLLSQIPCYCLESCSCPSPSNFKFLDRTGESSQSEESAMEHSTFSL